MRDRTCECPVTRSCIVFASTIAATYERFHDRFGIFPSSQATELLCSPKRWMGKCFEVPRRFCPEQYDRGLHCTATPHASIVPPRQSA
jgi:hypothetical protein